MGDGGLLGWVNDIQERWMGSWKRRWEVRQFVTKFVWVPCQCLVSSPGTSHSSPGWCGSGEGIYDNWVPFGGSAIRQIRGVQRKPLPAFAVFQVPSAQHNQCTKASYFNKAICLGVACPKLPWSYFWVHILLPFSVFICMEFILCQFASRWLSSCADTVNWLVPFFP